MIDPPKYEFLSVRKYRGTFQVTLPPNKKAISKQELIFTLGDRKYAVQKRRIFENVSVNDLPKGFKYTWVLTEDRTMSFGQVLNRWEYGVKHAHVANTKKVVAAGEMELAPDGRVKYNLSSGTFSRRYVEVGPRAAKLLESLADEAFKSQVSPDQLQYVKSNLLKDLPAFPTQVELISLCADTDFLKEKPNAELCRTLELHPPALGNETASFKKVSKSERAAQNLSPAQRLNTISNRLIESAARFLQEPLFLFS